MKPTRIPLTTDLTSRTNSPSKDARIVNGYVEKVGQNNYVIKRPGTTPFYTPPAVAAGNGIYALNGVLYSFIGTAATAGTNNLTSVAGTALAGFIAGATGGSTGTGTVGLIGGLTSIAGTALAGFIAGALTTTTTSGRCYFTNTTTMPYLVLQNLNSAWALNISANSLIQIVTPTFPTNQTPPRKLVPGIVYMNNTVFVLTQDGRIYNSGIEDPLTWGALDYIGMSSEPDRTVALAKTNNYLVAFGESYTEFFYYGGAPTGSPLLPNLSLRLEIGCASADSIVKFPNQICFIGGAKEAGRSVYVLKGGQPIPVSTKAVETYINNDPLTNVSSFAIGVSGHDLYVLTLPASNVTLVYDLLSGEWSEWSSLVNGVEQYFELNHYAAIGATSYLQNAATGYIITMKDGDLTDEGAPIPFRIVTPRWEGDSNNLKFFQSLEIIADKVVGSLNIRHSDDDYSTWSAYRSVDLSASRPIIRQLGSARRRAFEFYDQEAKPLRILGVDALLREGTF
jgi:hypothetical protein